MNLTDEEKRVLTEILNIANKAAGLQVAEMCIYFLKKMEDNGPKDNGSSETSPS